MSVAAPLFVVENAKKSYGRRTAVTVEKLEIARGDRVIVSGPNGCGKSTLLRVVAGMTNVDKGSLTYSAEWHTLSIGYLPQDGGSYRDLTILENQQAFECLLGRRTDSVRAAAVADRLEIASLLHRRIGDLSGGYRRLASIHGLMTSGADALVLDEPIESLDSVKIAAVTDAIRMFASEYAFILVSGHANNYPQMTEDNLWSKEMNLVGQGPDDVSSKA
jgi:ABC-type multidrug transport system ATPase subunit